MFVGTRGKRARGAAALIMLLLAAGAWGCTASRAFQRGHNAAMILDWDLAVSHYAEAVKSDPRRADYKMALERAQLAAAQSHFEKARAYETRDQLDLALLEYRRVVEYQPSGQEARAAIQRLEQTIRDRIEAARPKPPAEAMRQQARKQMEEPALDPASREPVVLKFQNRPIREILDFLGSSTGINVAYDKDFLTTLGNQAINVNIDGVTLEEALQQILAVNGAYYKVLNPRSLIVIADSAAKRGVYDEQAVQTFYLSSAEAETIEQLLTKIVTVQTTGLRPTFAANKVGNSITVRGTLPALQMVERLILMNDKPRAEISVDVEILEVNRGNAKQYGLDLSSYQVGLAFSPETRPDKDTASSIFNLNTISAGVSAADFYGSVPTAVVRFLEQDSETKVIAKPNLRGAEGEKLSLRLGEETPVPSTTFYNPLGGSGNIATTPLTSFTYKNIGVNLDIEPRVTYDGDIILKVALEISAKGPDQNVAGQNLPSFFSRKVETRLRLRDGESNLLAGLLRENERKTVKGFPGISRVPILRDLFASNDKEIVQTDIVMLLTPHVVRTHALTQKDFTPVFVGTQGNLGLAGPPPLIQPAAAAAATAAPRAPAAAPAGAAQAPGQPAAGTAAAVQMPPAAAAPGLAAAPPAPVVPQPPAPPPAGAGAQPPPPAQAAPVAAAPPPQAAPVTAPPPAPAQQPQADALRIILTPPGAPLMMAAQPATVPISVFGASRVSTVTLSLRFDPKVLRVRLVQEGTFLSSGGGTVTFAQQVDAASGRVDITLTRPGDLTGVSGDGVLASVVFDAVGSGISPLGLGGVVTGPGGLPVPVAFGTASVTVR
jgi:type II secretory pathway component GspD/PulD (secretin)